MTKATEEEKHQACWNTISRNDVGGEECLVCGEWRCDCAGCAWELEENKVK